MMTNQQILEKAIQKAIDGGWKPLSEVSFEFRVVPELYYVHFLSELNHGVSREMSYPDVIFSHDFAKALWGEDEDHALGYIKEAAIKDGHKRYGWQSMKAAKTVVVPLLTIPTWQYHLQQMVIAEDPLQYLGEHI